MVLVTGSPNRDQIKAPHRQQRFAPSPKFSPKFKTCKFLMLLKYGGMHICHAQLN